MWKEGLTVSAVIWREPKMETRKKQLHFMVNETEEELIRHKMSKAGISNMAVYLRKMAIDGYTIKLNLDDMNEVVRLLRIDSNNLNQYAKKANETGGIYAEDIADIKKYQEEMWELLKELLKRLSSIQKRGERAWLQPELFQCISIRAKL